MSGLGTKSPFWLTVNELEFRDAGLGRKDLNWRLRIEEVLFHASIQRSNEDEYVTLSKSVCLNRQSISQ